MFKQKKTSTSLAISILVTNVNISTTVTFSAISGLKIIKSCSTIIELDCSGIIETIIEQSEVDSISCSSTSPDAGTLDDSTSPTITFNTVNDSYLTNNLITIN